LRFALGGPGRALPHPLALPLIHALEFGSVVVLAVVLGRRTRPSYSAVVLGRSDPDESEDEDYGLECEYDFE